VGIDVSVAIDVQRPRSIVAAYATDAANTTAWYPQIDEAVLETPAPIGVGSRMRFRARFMGKVLRYTYEVVAHEPGHRLVMRNTEGPFAMQTTYEWTENGPGSTRMTIRNRGGPTGLAGLMSPFMAMAARRGIRKALRQLKANLEAGRADI
jgi:uncharacterized protein YndB with AHSA1/START domain